MYNALWWRIIEFVNNLVVILLFPCTFVLTNQTHLTLYALCSEFSIVVIGCYRNLLLHTYKFHHLSTNSQIFFSVLFLFRCTKQTTQINLHVACIQMNFSLNAARLHSINTANVMKPMLWKKWHYLKDLPFIRQPLISDNLMTPAMRYYRNNHK